ncbi:MAG: hypothetical protein ACI406_14215 [Victivallis vadensis]
MNSGLGERMGSAESELYGIAHSVLCGGADFSGIKTIVTPEYLQKLSEAIRVLRENVPEYRDVRVPGLDEE